MSAINATPNNIEWLLEKLYKVDKELKSRVDHYDEHKNRVYVCVAKTKAERHAIENVMFHYMAKKYGFNYPKVEDNEFDINPLDESSMFRFPNGIKISVIDLEHP